MGSAMVPLDRALVSSYKQSILLQVTIDSLGMFFATYRNVDDDGYDNNNQQQ